MKRIGILAFHGDVIEHFHATRRAITRLRLSYETVLIRTKKDLEGVIGLIIPGGESTVLHKLSERAGIFEDLKKIDNIFGTCAGAIMLAKVIKHKTADQQSLALMDIAVDRNAYGRQNDSFEKDIDTKLGKIHAVFIRAPKINKIGKNTEVLAQLNGEIIACQQKISNKFYLATCFHPELTATKFHEYFLQQI